MTPNKIYALLVGINEYESPAVPNLDGTSKDLNDMKEHIESSYTNYDIQMSVLQDKDATRANIIKQFESHLGLAQEGDIALFYYSGHGAQGRTNQAFWKFDPDEMEEGLVCHDSRVDGKYDLADKELAVLLHFVARNNPEIVLLVDSCHSGSMTRYVGKTRMTSANNNERGLENYLHDANHPQLKHFYLKQYEKTGDIEQIPTSRHLSMSACSETEVARETEEGGWFTQALLETLRSNKEPISYFQLYRTIFSKISQYPETQTPQFEAYGMFNAKNNFLSIEKNQQKEKRFRVIPKGGTKAYRIDFGAQTGIPLDIERAINFEIFEQEGDEIPIGTGSVNSIGINDSTISLDLHEFTDVETFWAEILDYAPSPLMICFEGHTEDLNTLNNKLLDRNLVQVLFVENDAVCRFIMAWQENDQCYRLFERGRPVFILEIGREDFENDHKAGILFQTLEQLAQWEYTVLLDNPKSRIDKSEVEVQFNVTNPEDLHKVTCECEDYGEIITMGLDEANSSQQHDYHKVILDYNDEQAISYQVSITNHSYDKYYIACVLITADYGAIPLSSTITLEPNDKVERVIDEMYGSLMIARTRDMNITNYLKIFISKQDIPTIQGLELSDLRMEEQLQHTPSKRNFAPRQTMNDWCTKTLALNLQKENTTIGQIDYAIGTKGIVIHGHDSLNASINLNSPAKKTRSADRLFSLRRKIEGFSNFPLQDGTRSTQSTLELSNIENDETLIDNPLKISVPKEDGGSVIPFTLQTVRIQQADGSYIEEDLVLPIGKHMGVDEQGNDLYAVHSLPTEAPNKGTRSLGKALKMCFAKIVMKKDNFNLCWVDYTKDVARQRVQSGVAEKVAAADKIVIVIHGILGDTGAMAQNLEFAKNHYDLVLTYDYENLNTPITETAAGLKKSLTAVGIVEGSGKIVDIVAHSMGGLVSRSYIESPELQGNRVVRKLFMLGTPNGGSVIANIGVYRDLAMTGLTFALNIAKLGTPALLSKWLFGLSGSKKLTYTLEQMHKDSEFLQQLNNNPAPADVQYYVIAGDITNYQITATKLMGRLMDWATVQAGKTMYWGQSNDVAVATDSIQGVPTYFNPILKKVDCHHMVYFVDEPSMKILADWMAEG